jgi:nitroreductase
MLARRSIREYKNVAIPREHLMQILEAGRQAPSAANRQPCHFVVVEGEEQKKRLATACRGKMWIAEAACIIVGLGIPKASKNWYRVDVAIAIENMVLAAHSLGYGTCWIGAFEAAEVKQVCEIPADLEVVVCLPVGVPNEAPAAKERKPWQELFSVDRYGLSLEK